MQWELIIYDEGNCNHYVDMKVFNDPSEIACMLKCMRGTGAELLT